MIYIGVFDDCQEIWDDVRERVKNCTISWNRKIKVVLFQSEEELRQYGGGLSLLFVKMDIGKEDKTEFLKAYKQRQQNVLFVYLSEKLDYALDAFELEAVGYLLLPIEEERFSSCMERIYTQLLGSVLQDDLIVVENRIRRRLEKNQIIYAKKEGNKCLVSTRNKDYLVYESMKQMKAKLGSEFLQVSQGVIVNRREIAGIKGSELHLYRGIKILVGRTFLPQVKKEFQEKEWYLDMTIL